MATDHALARSLAPGRGVLRLYRWDPPTLSLGRNEPARDRCDVAGARARGIGIVRRPTGGRAVLHGPELTYAVVAPIEAFGGPRAAYRTINEALVRGLARLGVPAGLAGADARGGALPPDAGPCFREPAEGEVVTGGRKLVGSAQARVGRVLLQHGSILLENRQDLVAVLLGVAGGRRSAAARTWEGGLASSIPGAEPAGLGGLLDPAPSHETVAAAVAAGFREAVGGSWSRARTAGTLPLDLLERYRSAEWTWRR
ncbi:MAG TPA: lipoate--protein ligase family protein [Longimicrobiales bacterium]|nr:lipoate--protein ligase family protein [Longimicrobiales bacterium]